MRLQKFYPGKEDRAQIFASNNWVCIFIFQLLAKAVDGLYVLLWLFVIIFFYKTLITSANKKLCKSMVDKKVEKALTEDIRFFIFPLNSTGRSGRKDPYHWTVLVCDKKEQRWIHYNSLLPSHTKKDPYLHDATVVVSYCYTLFLTHAFSFVLFFIFFSLASYVITEKTR